MSGGTAVTITGTGFAATTTAVNFGTAPAASFTVNSDTSITATSSATSTAGTADVTVTTANGTSSTSPADQFTYVAAPTVTSINPTSGPTVGGTTVTITGMNFTGTPTVKFGTTTATGVVVASSTSLTAVSPAESAGAVDVRVTTIGGTSATSSADQFTYVVLLAPAISNIAVSGISTTSATISWNTNLPASSQVLYGTTTSYGHASAFDATATTSHSVLLSGLADGTVYHFAVSSGNIIGTTTSSDNIFVTESTPSSTPLAVTGVDSVSSVATADGNFADGWKWTMHLTVPDTENAFRMKFSDWTGGSNSFGTANDVRIFSPESSNAGTEGSAVLMTAANTYGGWMYLTGDTSTTTPGRQIDVVIEVRVPSGTPAGSYTTTFGAQSVPQSATSTTP